MASTPVARGKCVIAPLETGDMQALIRRAYGELPFARYMFLSIGDAASARAWLGTIASEVTTAAVDGEDIKGPCINVAITGPGLLRLGLTRDDIKSSRPLLEGMVTPHRSRILGDSGTSEPTTWRWGGPNTPETHVLLMVFATSDTQLNLACTVQRSAFEAGGALSEVGPPVEGRLIDEGREHFGFADGVSQPTLKDWPHAKRSLHPPAPPQPDKWAEVNPGEIVLGYCDNFDKLSEGPSVPAGTDPNNLLPPWPGTDRHHLGHNGTFLVFRELAQDVVGFSRLLESADATADAGATGGMPATPGLIGAKIVGRWPNGAPLVLAPDCEAPAHAGANAFGYHDLDQDGLRCPAGAHVRRANPRDSSTNNPEKALSTTRNHRIMRRGRPYGLPIATPATKPGEKPADERGLVFICLNADIERQFEFVQHTWLNNPYFAGLYGDVDPLVGSPPEGEGTLILPADPIRRKVTGIPNFVTVRGGGYFFLPGIRALRYLAAL